MARSRKKKKKKKIDEPISKQSLGKGTKVQVYVWDGGWLHNNIVVFFVVFFSSRSFIKSSGPFVGSLQLYYL